MHGLLMVTTGSRPLVGESAKFVWRITGSGTPRFTATDQSGHSVKPDWGPDSHGDSSNFSEPGDEWGMGFTFPTAGCWRITVRRGNTSAWAGVDVRN